MNYKLKLEVRDDERHTSEKSRINHITSKHDVVTFLGEIMELNVIDINMLILS